jgi:uncharacterized protein YeaO (DUF488 family)
MKNGGIFKDRPELNPDQVNKGKNFDQLLSKINPTNAGQSSGKAEFDKSAGISKIKSALFALAGVAAVVTAVILYNKFSGNAHNENEPVSTVSSTSESLIKPPFGDSVIPFEERNIDPSVDQILLIGRSQIKIPANAIMSSSGNIVKEPVTIKFREFHTLSEVFASGIPMHYDTAATRMFFETAGMFELRAELSNNTDHEELAIHKEKPIEVSWNSKSSDTYFNQYYYNEDKQAWDFIVKDRPVISNPAADTVSVSSISEPYSGNVSEESGQIAEENKQAEKLLQEIVKLETQVPAPPVQADEGAMLVSIDADSKHFPELQAYAGYKFEVLDLDRFDERQGDKEWNNIKVVRGNRKGSYILQFWRPGEEYNVECRPVLEGKDYDNALAKYEEMFEEYNQGIEAKKAELRKLREMAKQEEIKAKVAAQEAMRQRQQAYAAERQRQYVQELTQRVFSVNNFGIWNCDAPQFLPKGQEVMLVKLTTEGQPLKGSEVYLVEKGRNTMFLLNTNQKIEMDPSKENVLVSVTENGKIAVADPVMLPADKSKVSECKATFKVFDDRINNLQDVQRLLSSHIDI